MRRDNNSAYISLGSNLGEREAIMGISDARKHLEEVCFSTVMSDIYSTYSISGDGRIYFNSVVRIVTAMEERNLQNMFKQWECEAGRDELARLNKIVPIDIDIVVFNGNILRPSDFERDYFQRGFQQLRSGDNFQPDSRMDL